MVVDIRTGERQYVADIPAAAKPGGSDADHLVVMARVPTHASVVGSPEGTVFVDADEMPQRTVTMPGYFVAITELTQAQWQVLAGTTPWTSLAEVASGPELPATGISYQQVITLLADASARLGVTLTLPSADEWEDAARAGATGASAFDPADVTARDAQAWVAENQNGNGAAHVVAQRNANAWGLYDTQGNVWEFIQARADDSVCVVRGGSWSEPARTARFGNRVELPISIGHPTVGLRLVARP
jgi:formylglycine-generating enzyme required for sulfatase activity